MCKIFKRNSLQITSEANKKVADFLDITLDLKTEFYKPYKKPNSNFTYIHKQSNHPPSIIKNLPKSINKRLSTHSKNAQIFNEACPAYTEALKRMDTIQTYNLIRHAGIKAMKRTKRESGILPGSTHLSTLMWPQMLRKRSFH